MVGIVEVGNNSTVNGYGWEVSLGVEKADVLRNIQKMLEDARKSVKQANQNDSKDDPLILASISIATRIG